MRDVQFEKQIGTLLAEYMAAADILGRLHVRAEVRARAGKNVKLSTLANFDEERSVRSFDGDIFDTVQNDAALAHVRDLNPVTRRVFDGLTELYKTQSFTVARLSNDRLVGQVQSELERLLRNGGTLSDFRRAVDRVTSKAGVEDLSRFHTETVFRTNIQTAYSAGRLEQQLDPDVTSVMPVLIYRTVGDDRVRPNHAAMDGFFARFDDDVWRLWYPPAGFNCRCSVDQAFEDDVDAKVLLVPGRMRMPAIPDEGFVGLGLGRPN
jgi:SPP1 gp7 family putative phage head morphogenesis protein